ncbi:DinB family protein [Flavobacterium sp. WC2409]|uniref:DinB family protein n=1 Tax=Flavobacterium sp. WC2409 TaxID=3234139 RepID=A0AB39VYZ1_9FLAO
MKSKTQLFIALWQEGRTRFTKQLDLIIENDLKKKLATSPNSLGFLIRHISDVELLFTKNIFGASEVKVIAKTVIAKKDTGEWTNLSELKEYSHYAYQNLLAILEKQTDTDWDTSITTSEFGTKTKAEALGRIVSHTAYHAGQMSIINKYGTSS